MQEMRSKSKKPLHSLIMTASSREVSPGEGVLLEDYREPFDDDDDDKDREWKLPRLEVAENSASDVDAANKMAEQALYSFYCLNELPWGIIIVQARSLDVREMVRAVPAAGEIGTSMKEAAAQITIKQTGDIKLYLAPYSTDEVIYPIEFPIEGSVCKVYLDCGRIRFDMPGFDEPPLDLDPIFLVNETPLPLGLTLSSSPTEVFQLPSCGARTLPLYSMIVLGGETLGLVEGGKYVVTFSKIAAAAKGGSLVTVTCNEEVVCEWPVFFAQTPPAGMIDYGT